MEIGRWYEGQHLYEAAIGRFQRVVDDYQTTNHVPEALHRLVECYLRLGVIEEANRYASVLGHNFPGSVWYRDSYKLMTGKEVTDIKEPEQVDGSLPGPAEDKSRWWDDLIP